MNLLSTTQISHAAVPHPVALLMLSSRAMTIFGVIAAITFSASSSAPTPLYRVYQHDLGLSPLLITAIFAVYAFSLLSALLTVGSLSDYVGRKPVILAALSLNALAMVLFAKADSATGLIVARAIQGFATGAATTTLGATILDTDRARGPVFNSVTAFLGLMFGALGSGVLISFAPHPTQLIYVVLLMVTGLEIAILTFMPETTTGKSGALAALRPQMHVAPQIRVPLLQAIPVNIAAWALGGLYLSLMPSLVRVATGLTSPLVGGVTVSALMLSGAVAVFVLRAVAAPRVLSVGTGALVAGVAITLLGIRLQTVTLMLLGAAVAGFGFGAAFSGNLRTILPLAKTHERAGLLSAFYVISYLSFSLPAIAAGLAVPRLGLPMTATVYGAGVIALALASLAARSVSARRPPRMIAAEPCPNA